MSRHPDFFQLRTLPRLGQPASRLSLPARVPFPIRRKTTDNWQPRPYSPTWFESREILSRLYPRRTSHLAQARCLPKSEGHLPDRFVRRVAGRLGSLPEYCFSLRRNYLAENGSNSGSFVTAPAPSD